jgi:hypothetical protein
LIELEYLFAPAVRWSPEILTATEPQKNLQRGDLTPWIAAAEAVEQVDIGGGGRWSETQSEKDNPQRVGPTLAAGVGWSRVGILQPTPAPVATRPATPAGFANPRFTLAVTRMATFFMSTRENSE